ncbi:hypothetical protein [Rhodococcus sp. (in: high G+C Gram-positive bacteria)]|uniref:hypothetical protein n=1 Tax=Rhodococcus sp. TaxID=1831 RepID=UPI003B8A6AC3
MGERYTPKVGDHVVIGPDFRKPGEQIVVYTVTKVNTKTISLTPLTGVGIGVRIAGYGVCPATGDQVAAAKAVDPAEVIAVGSIVTVSSREGALFVVVGETPKGFTITELNGAGTSRLRAPAVALRKVQIDTAALLASVA